MQKQCVVLTLGRLPVALDLARSFSAMGFRVVVAEPFGMHLCRMSKAVDRSIRVADPSRDPERYLDELAAAVLEESAALVVPVSEETLRVALLKDRLPESVEVFAADSKTLLQVHDKYRFAKTARELGLDAPLSFLPREGAQIPPEAGSRLVVKPRHACSGRGVRYVDARTIGDAPGSVAADELVQARIDGREVSSFAVVRRGRVLALSIYEGTILSGSVAVGFRSIPALPEVSGWVERFVEAVDFTGFVAFDFIIDGGGRAYAIECNPRATSGIHFVPTAQLAGLVTSGEAASPGTGGPIALTESWSGFTALLGKLAQPRQFHRVLRELRSARDVTWSRRDPWPFLLMPVNTAPILWRALRRRATFAEVAVSDLEWRSGNEEAIEDAPAA
ncbi:MAG: ATP-grasp domain-containing protein [Pseudomonadota bacterium]